MKLKVRALSSRKIAPLAKFTLALTVVAHCPLFGVKNTCADILHQYNTINNVSKALIG